ncbi:YihA family ribosome biogenesis GTP-binding protein [bacterium]|nr:MAG: YihA family ribosome biogenesis GTP-binding protein [bacterium]
MEIKQANFVKSAPSLEHCPTDGLPEVCFAGRSNVGKSSLINALTNRKKLAKTSNTPGKTRELNYYLINDTFYIVDLPGYGFAKVSKAEKKIWGEHMQAYLLKRETLNMVFVIIDARHEPSALDKDFVFWLAEHGIAFSCVLSKMDKLSKNQQQSSVARLKRILRGMNIEVPITAISSETRDGIPELTTLIGEFL